MQINTFIESLKFRQDRLHSGIGTIQKYYMTVFPGKYGYSVVPYFTLPLIEPITPSLVESMQKLLDPYDIVVKNENDVLILVVVHSLSFLHPDFVGILPQALEKTVGMLEERGFTQPQTCTKCHETATDLYFYAHGVHRPMHKKCLEPDELAYLHPNQPAPEIDDVESHVKSLLYAMILMIAFAIPSFLTAIYYPFFYPFLHIFIPLGGLLGVRMGHGNVTGGTFRLLNGMSYGLSILLVFWRWNLSALGEGSSFFTYFVSMDLIAALLIDLAIGSVMVTVGMALFRRVLPLRKL